MRCCASSRRALDMLLLDELDTKVPLFTLAAGQDLRCVHFPLRLRVGRPEGTETALLAVDVDVRAFLPFVATASSTERT
jgi:hypothetical protein